MYCTNCGATIPDDVRFCTKCGAKIEAPKGDGAVGESASASGAQETVAVRPSSSATSGSAESAAASAHGYDSARQAPPANPQTAYSQPAPQQAVQQYPAVRPTYGVASLPATVGEWLVTLLIVGIPIVGFIALLIWAFGSTTDISKQNWAKAQLLWMVIVVVVWLLLVTVFGVSLRSMLR